MCLSGATYLPNDCCKLTLPKAMWAFTITWRLDTSYLSFTSFGWGVSEEKNKMWKVNRWQTTDDGRQVMVKAHIAFGKVSLLQSLGRYVAPLRHIILIPSQPSTMDWCSVYLTPQGLPKYIYLSPPLIFPTTYNGIGTKNRPVWITLGATNLVVGSASPLDTIT
jgi:hypothetical protein